MSKQNIVKNKWKVDYRPSFIMSEDGKSSTEWKSKSVMAYGSLHAAIEVCASEHLDPRFMEFRSRKE